MCESGEQCKPSDATSSIVVAIVIMGSVVHISSHKIMSASSSLSSSKSKCWQHFHFQVALVFTCLVFMVYVHNIDSNILSSLPNSYSNGPKMHWLYFICNITILSIGSCIIFQVIGFIRSAFSSATKLRLISADL